MPSVPADSPDGSHGWQEADDHGGRCSRILDFTNPRPARGGHDPQAPQHRTTMGIRGRLLTGHTWDLADPSAPVWTDPADTMEPGSRAELDARCPGCVSSADFGPYGDDTMMVIGHERGCPWLAAVLRASGLAS